MWSKKENWPGFFMAFYLLLSMGFVIVGTILPEHGELIVIIWRQITATLQIFLMIVLLFGFCQLQRLKQRKQELKNWKAKRLFQYRENGGKR